MVNQCPQDEEIADLEYIDQISSCLVEDDFVSINVCGMMYETTTSTLERFPSTLLGNVNHRKDYFVESKNVYFFDRHRQSFEAILYYYQSGGTLIRPPHMPISLFIEEIEFFCLGEDVLLNLRKKEGRIQEEVILPKLYLQRQLWELFELPDSSIAAKVIACWSTLVIVTSIIVFCMETMPMFEVEEQRRKRKLTNDEFLQPWFSFELGCIIWFAIEYIIRLLSSPDKRLFLKSFLNIIDLLAIIPYFIMIGINNGDTTPLSVLRIIRLVRVFRILKLARHSNGLQILGRTLKASASELAMLMFFMSIGIVLFSSAMYYAEQNENGMFTSIPDAFWYSLVTMTTVGYGDKVPKTLVGKLVGSICSLSGILAVALPLPVIVSNFQFYYNQDSLNYKEEKVTPTRKISSVFPGKQTECCETTIWQNSPK